MVVDNDFIRFVASYTERQTNETPWDRSAREQFMAKLDSTYAAMPILAGRGWPDDQSVESLDKFFTPEILGRVIFSPKTPDLTDDWGMFGTYPSFIIVQGLNYKGVRCLADEAWLCGTSLKTDRNLPVPIIEDFNYFPKAKLHWNMAGGGHHENVYEYLSKRFALTEQRQASRPRDNSFIDVPAETLSLS